MTMRYTNTDFLNKLKSISANILPLEEYKGSSKKVRCRCLVCNHIWEPRANHLLEGHGCPKCNGGIKQTEEEFVKRLATINPFIHPMGKYVNARTKIQCICYKCKQSFSTEPDKLLHGAGCSVCDQRNKSSFPEQAIFYYIAKKYSDATNRYYIPGSRIELDVYIPHRKIGLEYDGIYWHRNKSDREKEKFEICKERKIKLVRIREEQLGIQGNADVSIVRKKPYYSFETLDIAIRECLEILGISEDVNTVRDSAEIRAQYYSILDKNSLESVYPNVAKEWNFEKNIGITPDMVSSGTNDKYWWRCRICGNEWYASVAGRTGNGKGCSECAKRRASEKFKKSHSDYLDQLKNVNPTLEVLEEYKTTHEPLLTRCKICGNTWPAAPANLLRGRRCPKCSKKAAAKKISETNKLRNIGRKQPSNKAVKQYDLDGMYIQTFESIKSAKKITGASKIGMVCNGKRKQSGGYIWRFDK